MHEDLDALIEHGDIDSFLGHIDGLCLDEDWEQLLATRDRCRSAVKRGKQLWGVAAHAEYRLALQAPGRFAAKVIEPGTGRFAVGPLPEVAASTHKWSELAEHLPPGPLAGVTAHERVIRGESLADARVEQASVFEIPLELQSFEPEYPVAEYEPDKANFKAPTLPKLDVIVLPPRGRYKVIEDGETLRPLLSLAEAWVSESNGRVEAVAVVGGPAEAIASLGLRKAGIAPLPFDQALAQMAWAAASGGAHGRRRGMAAGRFGAWWAAAAVADLLDEWPVRPQWLGEEGERLRWWAWGTPEPETGWHLRLAVHDPDEDLSWVINASDSSSL